MRPILPIDEKIPAAVRLLREHRNLVVTAPPGAGKTTRLPAALLDHGLVPPGQEVLVLEPRRIAARMAAARVAAERGGLLGEEVGYRVRFERSVSSSTRLCFVTEGILVRRLQSDPELKNVAAVVCDEFHERSLDADLALAFLRETQQTIRPDLLLMVMSATLQAEPISRYLEDCPILALQGRSFPLEIVHQSRRGEEPVEERAAGVLRQILRDGQDGGVLIFMPGAAEIRRTMGLIAPLAESRGFEVLPLHGDLPPQAQQAAVLAGKRPRIVVATNVAEASITVEGCTTVIDSGLARVARYDPFRGLNRLQREAISRSSAGQRAGRAGRTGPGRCFRLYTEADYAAMAEAEEPEARRVDLCGAYLQILAWGTRDPEAFPWLTSPDEASVSRALELLTDLGAIAGAPARVTDTGRAMCAVPAHPRIARMLVESRMRGCLPEAALLAALLIERDIRSRSGSFGPPTTPRAPETSAPSDLLILAEQWETARRLHFDPGALSTLGCDAGAARRCDLAASHFRRLFGESRRPAPFPWPGLLEEDLLRSTAAGFPDRVVRRRAPDSREGLMAGGMGTRLDPGSSVLHEQFYVALDATPSRDRQGRRVLVRLASGVRAEWLSEIFPHMLHVEGKVEFDQDSERVVGRKVTLFRDLPVEESETGSPDPELAAEALYEAAARRPDRALTLTRDLEDLLARIHWLHQRRPGLSLPAACTGSAERAGRVDPLLLEGVHLLCRGRKSFEELRRAPLLDGVLSLLDRETRRLLESEAPGRCELPSGRSARLEYRIGEPPALAARIQDFFGCRTTPRVARGEVPVVLHLLAPSGRPVQVTSDLESFWKNAYPKLRIALRGRYPKHSWPENPLAPPRSSAAKPADGPRRA